jgi:hypothetical protein
MNTPLQRRFSGVLRRPSAHETVFNGFILLVPLEPAEKPLKTVSLAVRDSPTPR